MGGTARAPGDHHGTGRVKVRAAGRALPGGIIHVPRCRQFPALSIDPCEVLKEAGASIGAKPELSEARGFPGKGVQDPASRSGGWRRHRNLSGDKGRWGGDVQGHGKRR